MSNGATKMHGLETIVKRNNEAQAKHDAAKPYDVIGNIIAYEDGTLEDDDAIVLFQHLIDTGLARQLQGSYGRTAASLIERGVCTPAKTYDDATVGVIRQRSTS
jgi:hypothetical protein